ncbi:MAG TPA: fructosamine kinase family protein [Promineifilum sp.]|nr:fructosamine kinase family protein [Promineifilum sp.]
MDIRRQVAAAAGSPVTDIAPLGGGCVSAVYDVRLGDGRHVVAKVDESRSDTLATEGFMLRYLAAQTALPVPAVVAEGSGVLLTEYIEGDSRFDGAAEADAAERLAALHALTAPTFGFERDTLIGGLRQPNNPTAVWLDFFAEQRLIFMAGQATRAGRLPAATRARVERLAGHLDRWLVEPAAPSLIHGDVWTTNVLARGGRITAFLDPAIYFADAEIELAFVGLFGTFGRAFYQRYHALRPLAPGFFEERRDLYNLYPLLVHVRLFGGSYAGQVERVLAGYGF